MARGVAARGRHGLGRVDPARAALGDEAAAGDLVGGRHPDLRSPEFLDVMGNNLRFMAALTRLSSPFPFK
jgi:hypothetical protein